MKSAAFVLQYADIIRSKSAPASTGFVNLDWIWELAQPISLGFLSNPVCVKHLNVPFKMAAPVFPTPRIIGTKRPEISYKECPAARVIAFNAARKVAIVYTKRERYYKLPGGGIDSGEQHEMAALREMQEETGGICYVADVVDDSGSPSLTEDEVNDGLGHLWLSVDEAKTKMAGAEPRSELGLYIKERDIYLLGEAIRRTEEEIA
ncbi:hypothetical protein VC83_08214 [Pseudogymnoascus destructans]|uniref:Nudix hydrolase domain-containing protein n=1 Tax=Pseudogymnoascus destructans TaxID=655981 RepID=A0A177A2W2_9PEZI|nr:uncharacterized protein VC83_08214 [Pseudogymnoascus destructans]OAF55274.1 hypothetical protein VC83_08214 [Pseudogymnoascus destructans]